MLFPVFTRGADDRTSTKCGMFTVYGLLFNDFKLAIRKSKLAQIFKMVAKQATLYLIFHMMKKDVYLVILVLIPVL